MPKKPLFALFFLALLLLLSLAVIRFKSRELREMRQDQERVAALGDTLRDYLGQGKAHARPYLVDSARFEASALHRMIYTDTIAEFFRATGVHFLGYPKLSEILFHAYTGQRFKDELEFRLFSRCHAYESGIDSLYYSGSAGDFSVWTFRGDRILRRQVVQDTLQATEWRLRR